MKGATVPWFVWFPDSMENENDERMIEVNDHMDAEDVALHAAEADWHEDAWEDGQEDASIKVAVKSIDGDISVWDVHVHHTVNFSARKTR